MAYKALQKKFKLPEKKKSLMLKLNINQSPSRRNKKFTDMIIYNCFWSYDETTNTVEKK